MVAIEIRNCQVAGPSGRHTGHVVRHCSTRDDDGRRHGNRLRRHGATVPNYKWVDVPVPQGLMDLEGGRIVLTN